MAEAFALVGTAVQLADIICTRVADIRRFWKDVHNAPQKIDDLIDHIKQHSDVLKSYQDAVAKQSFGGDTTSTELIKRSEAAANCLQDAAEALRPKIKPSTHLGVAAPGSPSKALKLKYAFKATLKKGDLQDLEDRLERANQNLRLAVESCILHLQQASRLEQATKNDLVPINATLATIEASNKTSLAKTDLDDVASRLERSFIARTQDIQSTVAQSTATISQELIRMLDSAMITRSRKIQTFLKNGVAAPIHDLQTSLSPLLPALEGTLQTLEQKMDDLQNEQAKNRDVQAAIAIISGIQSQQQQQATLQLQEEGLTILKAIYQEQGQQSELLKRLHHLKDEASPGELTNANNQHRHPIPAMTGKPDISASTNDKCSYIVSTRRLTSSKTRQTWYALPFNLGLVTYWDESVQTTFISDEEEEGEASYVTTKSMLCARLIPNVPLLARLFEFSANAYGQWQYSFQPLMRRLLGRDHPILKAIASDEPNARQLIRDRVVLLTDVVQRERPLIHYALEHASVSFCSWLLQIGADAHARDLNGQNALPCCWRGQSEPEARDLFAKVKLLVEQYDVDPTTIKVDTKAVDKLMDARAPHEYLIRVSADLSCMSMAEWTKTLLLQNIDIWTTIEPEALVVLIEQYRGCFPDDPDYRTEAWLQKTPWFMWVALDMTPAYYHRFPALASIDVKTWITLPIRAGADVHERRRNVRGYKFPIGPLDYILDQITEYPGTEDSDVLPMFFENTAIWLLSLHKAGIRIGDYLEKEEQLHDCGILDEISAHYYLVYPAFSVYYGEQGDDILFCMQLLVVAPVARSSIIPGEWIEDLEFEYCARRGKTLRHSKEIRPERDRVRGWLLFDIEEETRNSAAKKAEEGAGKSHRQGRPNFAEVVETTLPDGRTAKVHTLAAISVSSMVTENDANAEKEQNLFDHIQIFPYQIMVDYGDGEGEQPFRAMTEGRNAVMYNPSRKMPRYNVT